MAEAGPGGQPGRDCPRCPRLVALREAQRELTPDWWNAPVPSFGAPDAALLIVGLAPGLRGANRTGRPFTGDHAGRVLYPALLRHGFAHGCYDEHPADGLRLVNCRITNAVRCVPPQNRPIGEELRACRGFLIGELALGPRLVLALGGVAHAAVLRASGLAAASARFVHGGMTALPGGRRLLASYHCSRYNMNTGRLTEAMFEDVIARAEALLGQARAAPGGAVVDGA